MPDLSSLAHWSASIKAESLSLFYASRDADVGHATRWLIEFALAYAMSPISLVPDAVPLLGYADSQILVPTLLWLARWSVPVAALVRAQERARVEPVRLQQHTGAAVVVALIWLAAIVALAAWSLHWFGTDALQEQAPLLLCGVALLTALALAAYVWRVVMGESILAGTPLGYLSVVIEQRGAPAEREAPLMGAQCAGSGM